MSNSTLETPPVMDVIIIPDSAVNADLVQIGQDTLSQQEIPAELLLGALARCAATAEHYVGLTKNRRSAADWISQHEHWIDETEKLIEINPQLIFKFFMTYEEVISNLNNPKTN